MKLLDNNLCSNPTHFHPVYCMLESQQQEAGVPTIRKSDERSSIYQGRRVRALSCSVGGGHETD